MEGQMKAFLLTPQYRSYVWGGHRLRQGLELTAEAWEVHEDDRIASGELAGKTLGEAAEQYGETLLGRRPVARTGRRFPLLIKLLDCAAWLSLQVHPNNEQAVRLEGPGSFGKTEAWHFLEAVQGGEILAGLRPGASPADLELAIRSQTVLEKMQRLVVQSGDTILIPAGMIHALGPGLLVYEVQQVSDITYRVFDWNRPASDGRPLHIEKSVAVANPNLTGQLLPARSLADGERQELVACEYFKLELVVGQAKSAGLDPQGESFHVLTAIEGQARVEGQDWSQSLGRFETIVVPASSGPYRVEPQSRVKVLVASV
jgi:mannose-6-phosphate isomerase